MAIRIFLIHITVVIYKIFISCIIWRIDIDYIYLSLMCISQNSKSFQIISFNQNMVWCIIIFTNNDTFRHLCQDGQFFAKTFFYVLRLIFPYQTISFIFS